MTRRTFVLLMLLAASLTFTVADLGTRATQPAAAQTALTPSRYVPLAPCRIVDTRMAGGRLGAGTQRTWQVTGTSGFAGQ